MAQFVRLALLSGGVLLTLSVIGCGSAENEAAPANSETNPQQTGSPSPGNQPAGENRFGNPSPNSQANTTPAEIPSEISGELAGMSDQFDDPATLANWKRVQDTEGWNADQLQTLDISQTHQGWLTMIPHTSVWYENWRGELTYREIEGDFVATTRVRVSNRAGDGPPSSNFSLGGIMVRAPRTITPETWQPGGENYVFLSLGAASPANQYHFEIKTTESSKSHPVWVEAGVSEAELRVIRIGSAMILMKKPEGQSWSIHGRFNRPDLPRTLQVGMTCYTDWETCSGIDPKQHNSSVIQQGNPDLIARFDYFTFDRPGVTTDDLSWMTEEQILAAFGDGPGIPVASNDPPLQVTEPEPQPMPVKPPQEDDISQLSDEFDNSATLKDWSRVFQTEQWGADQLENIDIGKTRKGWLVMVPYTSSWYQDYRGILVYKPVAGDFVVTTQVRVAQRGGDGPPRSQFSLAGIMVRSPRDITPQTWQPGGENYIFLSMGAANQPGSFQFEVKTTQNSNSQLEITSADTPTAEIRVARIGANVITLLKRPGGEWQVHRRYHRQDMPKELQVGLTCYTDWPGVEQLQPRQHNATTIRQGNPDLVCGFDYVRYRRPQVPGDLQNQPLSDPNTISDERLLSFLGASVDQ